jgi:hypothetical protein
MQLPQRRRLRASARSRLTTTTTTTTTMMMTTKMMTRRTMMSETQSRQRRCGPMRCQVVFVIRLARGALVRPRLR